MTQEEFVRIARIVVERRGKPQWPGSNSLVYEDTLICIRTNYNGLDLEVTRKAVIDPNAPHLRVSNPTTMVVKGEIIRHHGEAAYLHEHLTGLLPNRERPAMNRTQKQKVYNTVQDVLIELVGRPDKTDVDVQNIGMLTLILSQLEKMWFHHVFTSIVDYDETSGEYFTKIPADLLKEMGWDKDTPLVITLENGVVLLRKDTNV